MNGPWLLYHKIIRKTTIISVNAEKAPEKIQHPFMTKAEGTRNREGT